MEQGDQWKSMMMWLDVRWSHIILKFFWHFSIVRVIYIVDMNNSLLVVFLLSFLYFVLVSVTIVVVFSLTFVVVFATLSLSRNRVFVFIFIFLEISPHGRQSNVIVLVLGDQWYLPTFEI